MELLLLKDTIRPSGTVSAKRANEEPHNYRHLSIQRTAGCDCGRSGHEPENTRSIVVIAAAAFWIKSSVKMVMGWGRRWHPMGYFKIRADGACENWWGSNEERWKVGVLFKVISLWFESDWFSTISLVSIPGLVVLNPILRVPVSSKCHQIRVDSKWTFSEQRWMLSQPVIKYYWKCHYILT